MGPNHPFLVQLQKTMEILEEYTFLLFVLLSCSFQINLYMVYISYLCLSEYSCKNIKYFVRICVFPVQSNKLFYVVCTFIFVLCVIEKPHVLHAQFIVVYSNHVQLTCSHFWSSCIPCLVSVYIAIVCTILKHGFSFNVKNALKKKHCSSLIIFPEIGHCISRKGKSNIELSVAYPKDEIY